MIPALNPGQAPASRYVEFLTELRLRGFEGDLSTQYADRTVLATDNSIYQITPQAVVFPRSQTDVVRIARLSAESRFSEIVLTPRGGGTGTNGQSLTDGIVIDLSRHMNRIIEVNLEEHWAWVEAGVVKDQLNAAIQAHGLFFAPELSPSNRATIGGMIATDASGQGSVLYGKTRDHVLELQCVLLDGTPWHASPLPPDELEAVKARDDRAGQVHRVLDDITRTDQALIAERFPELNRCVTGYDLVHVRDALGRFQLSSVLCGAEGTLAFVTAAKVNLSPIPRHSAVVNIRYASFDSALRDARVLMQLEAASSETIDATVLKLARGDSIWLGVAKYFPDDPQGPAQGVNLVEFLGDDEDALNRKLARVESLLAVDDGQAGRRGYTIARDEAAILAIWSMRKKSVGLLGNMEGEARPVPFVEDTVVPPAHLADYIREFRSVLDRRGLVYGMFGHVDAGCLHVRPALDMKDPSQEKLVREISDEVYLLTRRYKGVLWGEHGKGVRSEYAPDFFGPLYPRLQELKAAFDPHNQLNPGKIAAPPGHALLRIDGVGTRGQRDRRIPIAVRSANQDSLHCNGNAACYNYDPDDAMCPSWKVTRERKHSPKGRASLMREWLLQLADQGVDPVDAAARARVGSRLARLPAKILNTVKARRGGEDFSHSVKEAMDGCLACKSCTGQCPIKVDVPAFRSRFLELYHSRYLRPIRDHAIVWLEQALPAMARSRNAANALLSSSVSQWAARAIGLVELPLLDPTDLRARLQRQGIATVDPGSLSQLSAAERARCVVIVQDAFTTFYDAQIVADFCALIARLGFSPVLAPFRPNGKPQHVLGMLSAFERTARANAKGLNELAGSGVEMVGIDPSMTLTYRAEYTKVLATDAPRVLLAQEWLVRHLDRLPDLASEAPRKWRLLPHCTERTNAAASLADWRRVFERVGIDLGVPATGCCGMAGLYGHQKEHRGTSEAIYRQSWARQIAVHRTEQRTMATGYSCRSQVKLVDGERLLHPVQVLLRQMSSMKDGPRAGPEQPAIREHHEEF